MGMNDAASAYYDAKAVENSAEHASCAKWKAYEIAYQV